LNFVGVIPTEENTEIIEQWCDWVLTVFINQIRLGNNLREEIDLTKTKSIKADNKNQTLDTFLMALSELFKTISTQKMFEILEIMFKEHIIDLSIEQNPQVIPEVFDLFLVKLISSYKIGNGQDEWISLAIVLINKYRCLHTFINSLLGHFEDISDIKKDIYIDSLRKITVASMPLKKKLDNLSKEPEKRSKDPEQIVDEKEDSLAKSEYIATDSLSQEEQKSEMLGLSGTSFIKKLNENDKAELLKIQKADSEIIERKGPIQTPEMLDPILDENIPVQTSVKNLLFEQEALLEEQEQVELQGRAEQQPQVEQPVAQPLIDELQQEQQQLTEQEQNKADADEVIINENSSFFVIDSPQKSEENNA